MSRGSGSRAAPTADVDGRACGDVGRRGGRLAPARRLAVRIAVCTAGLVGLSGTAGAHGASGHAGNAVAFAAAIGLPVVAGLGVTGAVPGSVQTVGLAVAGGALLAVGVTETGRSVAAT